MITLKDYFKEQEPHEGITIKADELITKVNRLMVYFHKDVPDFVVQVTSGYRSPAYNKKIGGKVKSLHMAGQAVDIYDPRKRLAKWCVANQARLEEQGLWAEDPRATRNWMHLQSVPPSSGNRFYIPDLASIPLCNGPLTVESLEVKV